MSTQTSPSEAARALAATLLMHAEKLDSTEISDLVEALPAVRSAARYLGNALNERGWGDDVLYGWPGQNDLDDDDGGDGWDDTDDLEDARERSLNGARFSYQSRFDFVIVDEQALYARAESRLRESDFGFTFDEALQEHGGPLGVLLLVDSPAFRGYEDAGVEMAYGKEVWRPLERTLDELTFDEREDHFPLD
jgi:hypothetical protein